MAEITQTISTVTILPTPPNPNSPSTFDALAYPYTVAQNAFGVDVNDMATELNTFATQTNAVRDEVIANKDIVVAKEALVSPHYSAIDTVSENIASINANATNIANINTVSANISNINNVESNISNVNTVASNIPNISIVVANIVDIQNAEENAQIAAQSANSASLTANVTKWISGTSYDEGDNVWSPIDFQTYRRKIAGAGTTDPSVDSTNWLKLGAGLYHMLDTTASNVVKMEDDGIYQNTTGKLLTLVNKNSNLVYANALSTLKNFVTVKNNNTIGYAFPNSDLSNFTANYTNVASKKLITEYAETSQIVLYTPPVAYGNALIEKIDENHILSVNFRDYSNLQVASIYTISEVSPFITLIGSSNVLEASTDQNADYSYLTKVSDGVFLLVSNYIATSTSQYNVRAQLILIDGSYNITTSSIVEIGVSSVNQGALLGVTKLDSNRYAIKYRQGALATSYFKLSVIKVETNNTITVGTAWQSATTFAGSGYSSNGIVNINNSNCYITSYGVDDATDYQRRYTFNITDLVVTMLVDSGFISDFTSYGCSFFNIPNTNVVLEARSMSSANYGRILTINTTTGVISEGAITSLSSQSTNYSYLIKQPIVVNEDATYIRIAVHPSLSVRVAKSGYAIALDRVITDTIIAKTASEWLVYSNTTVATKRQHLIYGNSLSNYNVGATPSFYGYLSSNVAQTRQIRSVLNGKFFIVVRFTSNRPYLELLAITKDLVITGEFYE